MLLDRYRLPIAILAFLIWVLITIGWGFWEPREATELAQTVNDAIAWNILLAGLFLLALTLVCRWRDIGFGPPRPLRSLLLLWLPAIYLVLFLFGVTLLGWPPGHMLAFLAVNTLFVGFSEELMFRGVLFRALLTRVSIWPAIWISVALFGAVHTLNVFVTGDLMMAAAQAVAAAMSGMLFMALVIRMGSIIPAMIFHAIWDFTTLSLASNVPMSGGAVNLTPLQMTLPVLFVLPNFLYGLYLLRGVGRDARWQRQPTASAA
ncbi:hypothetical protein XM25_15733 [Devosia sp. H5989]|nr:hypothetical protein XM25_15733 [Devosia sp. H5989]